MRDLRYYSPTEVVFGRDAEDKTGETAARYGSRVLLVYGMDSMSAGIFRKNRAHGIRRAACHNERAFK